MKTTVKKLCARCLVTNACSCGTDKYHVQFPAPFQMPAVNARSGKWKQFLKEARYHFRRSYLTTDDKDVKQRIEALYAKHNIMDIFEKSTGIEKENPDKHYEEEIPDASFEIALEDNVIAKYGGGLYMRLVFVMAQEDIDLNGLYLRLKDNKTDSNSVKVYEKLRKKLKKITGYDFRLAVTSIQPEQRGWNRSKAVNVSVWVTDLPIPPALKKLPGRKRIIKEKHGSRTTEAELKER